MIFSDPFASAGGAANATSSSSTSSVSGLNMEESSGEFKRASPSMFDSPGQFDNSGKQSEESVGGHHHQGAGADVVDFMANQESAWIQSAAVAANNQHVVNHPFMIGGKGGDSGFISPACASNNQSASSEDSAENHAERETSPENDLLQSGAAAVPASSASAASGQQNLIDEEEEESREVSKLLAKAGGPNLDELMSLSDREGSLDPMQTPPGEEDNGECCFTAYHP